MYSGKVLLGLLSGVAIGATVGILFAPEKGSRTRSNIGKKGEDYIDSLGDKYNDFIDEISDQMDSAKDKANRVMEKGKFKMDEHPSMLKGSANQIVSAD